MEVSPQQVKTVPVAMCQLDIYLVQDLLIMCRNTVIVVASIARILDYHASILCNSVTFQTPHQLSPEKEKKSQRICNCICSNA